MNKRNSGIIQTGIVLIILFLIVIYTDKSGISESTKTIDGKAINTSYENGIIKSSADIFAMDTYMTITCYGNESENAVSAAVSLIHKLDELLSIKSPTSDIYKINTTKSAVISDETEKIISNSIDIYNKTNGAFDITIYPIMELWGFTSGDMKKPDPIELNNTLKKTGSEKIRLNEATNTITIPSGYGIDLGGAAKGYTTDKIMELFTHYDIISAIVSLGGNIACYKSRPDGSDWRCGIRNPFSEDNTNAIGVLNVSNKAIITSGAYERYFIEDGIKYHHIINPANGYPSESDLESVTVVTENGLLADCLTTSFYILGLDDTIDYYNKYGDNFDLILIDKNKKIYITDGIKDSFKSDSEIIVIPSDKQTNEQ